MQRYNWFCVTEAAQLVLAAAGPRKKRGTGTHRSKRRERCVETRRTQPCSRYHWLAQPQGLLDVALPRSSSAQQPPSESAARWAMEDRGRQQSTGRSRQQRSQRGSGSQERSGAERRGSYEAVSEDPATPELSPETTTGRMKRLKPRGRR